MPKQAETRTLGIDPRTHEIILGRWRMRLPQSRALRILVGCLLILGGCLGFLPILGFWMIPVGIYVLSYDIAAVRRRRRRLAVSWGRRKRK